ncbi:MAG: nitrite/sulfite reductase [Dehalococcoidia bacterium]|nr:nitrite/sulfite reductase [Dehalococcoidia bacterium]
MTGQVKGTTASQGDIHAESLRLAQNAKGIIPFMEQEVVSLEEEIKAFRAGQREPTEFMPFRLRQGVYGQRQPDAQMLRVKIPGGILTPEALELLGAVIDKYAPLKKGHVTTRENVQIHNVALEDAGDAMRMLAQAGLSTREACGNTVRNVVGYALSGVCPDEVFDPTRYLAAYVRFAVRHPVTQNFPRKFKTSFTGCVDHDSVASAVHDLSYIAQVRNEGGVEKRGFKVMVGGATSIMPRLGKVLYDFVPEEDYLRVAEAIWRVFDKAAMLRKNRMMARIKVLIDRIGFEAFKEQVDEELKGVGPIDATPLMNIDEVQREEPPSIPAASRVAPLNGQEPPAEFLHWKENNTTPQKQAGYFVAHVKLPLGDIYVHQFPVLAGIVRKYTGGRARTTQEQNLALRFVPEGYLYDVWKELKEIGLVDAGAHTITDVVSCPGTDSCKLGITASMGLGRAIKDELESWNGLGEDPLVKKMHVKMSGCPNGCGLHHIASIGFHGAAMKGPGGVQVPAYELFLGGHYGGKTHEETRFGQRLPGVKVPAKRVPQVVKEIAGHYKVNRREGEEFRDFVDRVGIEPFAEIAVRHREVEALGPDTMDVYMDWDKPEVYKLERGEGECAV